MAGKVNTTGARTVRADLESSVAGPMWWPGEPGIDAETAGFNTAVRHRPAVVVGAATPTDVAAAVRYAGRVGLPVGVHATGHGGAPSQASVLVTTRRMARFSVDPAARQVTVQAGVTWGTVIRAAATYGWRRCPGQAHT